MSSAETDGRPSAAPRVPKASDLLAERLRAQILGRGLQPGDPLPSEAQIIAEHGFSRGTVREALRLLEVDGLIEIRRGPKGGVRVRHPEVSQIGRSLAVLLTLTETSTRAVLEFRKLVEPAAAAGAARSASRAQCQVLVDIAEDGAGQRSLGRSIEFHEAVGACSGNRLLEVAVNGLGVELAWHTPGEPLSESDIAGTHDAHRSIARAIAAGNEQRAARLMLGHIEEFERVLDKHGRLDQPIVPRERWMRARPPYAELAR